MKPLNQFLSTEFGQVSVSKKAFHKSHGKVVQLLEKLCQVICVYVCACARARMHTCMHVRACAGCVYMYARACVCACACMCVCTA